MDAKLLLSVAVIVGMRVAAAFERRANKARAGDKTASFALLIVVKVPGSVSPTERVAKYDEPLAVALTRDSLGKAFTDHDRDAHPEGEEWTFLRSAFVPYHSGLSWFVSFDGVQETHIRMQSTPEEQGNIVNNLADYLVAV